MTKLSGASYPGLRYEINAGDLVNSGALATGPVAGYVTLDTLPAGAVVHYVEMEVPTVAAGVTTITGQLVTHDTGTTNNETTYGAATTLKSTSTDVFTGGFVAESRTLARDLKLKVALATGSEVATSVTAGKVWVHVMYSVRGSGSMSAAGVISNP